jgi:hypothetical protein
MRSAKQFIGCAEINSWSAPGSTLSWGKAFVLPFQNQHFSRKAGALRHVDVLN